MTAALKAQLDVGHVHVGVDDLVAEGGAGDGACGEALTGLGEGAGTCGLSDV